MRSLGLFALAGPLARGQDVVRHAGVRGAWPEAIHLHVRLANLIGHRFSHADQSRLGGGVGGEVGARPGNALSAEQDHLPRAAFPHVGQHCAQNVDGAEQVDAQRVGPLARVVLVKRADGTEHPGPANKRVDGPELHHFHAVDGRSDGLIVADVGA